MSNPNTNPIEGSEILPVPNALLGIDVSHYQGVVQWDLVAEAGVKFAWIKATDGTATDAMLKANLDGVRATGLPFGFYHFWRPGLAGLDQARPMLGLLDEFWPVDPPHPALTNGIGALPAGMIGIALDVEVGSMNEDEQNEALACIHAWDFGFRYKSFVYCSPGYAAANLTDPAWLSYPLWVAHYTDLAQPNIGKWPKWTFWQRQARARIPGILSDVDIDWYNGSAEDLQAMLALPSTVERLSS